MHQKILVFAVWIFHIVCWKLNDVSPGHRIVVFELRRRPEYIFVCSYVWARLESFSHSRIFLLWKLRDTTHREIRETEHQIAVNMSALQKSRSIISSILFYFTSLFLSLYAFNSRSCEKFVCRFVPSFCVKYKSISWVLRCKTVSGRGKERKRKRQKDVKWARAPSESKRSTENVSIYLRTQQTEQKTLNWSPLLGAANRRENHFRPNGNWNSGDTHLSQFSIVRDN